MKVRIVVHSTLHAQNPLLCDFLRRENDTPTSTTKVVGKVSRDILKLDRDEMVKRLGASLLHSSRLTPPKEENLLDTVSSLSRPQMCSTSQISKHLLRVTAKLWRTLVFGTGDTDLVWANPASIVPLRVHAFGSLLQIIGNSSMYMLKSGVTQVDGTSKFDLVTLGNVLALLFDEEALFGRNVSEVLDDRVLWFNPTERAKGSKRMDTSSKSGKPDILSDVTESTAKPQRKKRHQRQTFEFGNSVDMSDPSSALGDFTFDASFLPPQRERSFSAEETKARPALPPIVSRARSAPVSGVDTTPVSDLKMSHLSPPSRGKSSLKNDSVADFKSNMEIGLNESTEDSFDVPLTASNKTTLMQKFGGMSGAGKNRWRTAPAPNLMTIREDEPGSEEPPLLQTPQLTIGNALIEPTDDSVAAELVIQPKKSSTKQMRVPRLGGRAAPNNPDYGLSAIGNRAAEASHKPPERHKDLGMIAETAAASSKKFNTLSGPPSSLKKSPIYSTPKSDEEIMSAGNAFLDSIGDSLGMR